MGMSIDNENKNKEELRSKISDALKAGDDNAISEALVRMAEGIQSDILQQARSAMNNELDLATLQARGAMTLTSEERSYYSKVIENRGFTTLDAVMPSTVFDRVFEDLVVSHPLLSAINFVNTSAVTEWVVRTSECVGALWGKLTGAITKELNHGFDKVKTDMYKLSAFMPVAKAMLDLGPAWLDRYVRTVLSESIAIGLETAIIAGTGKDQPIGMLKNLKGAVTGGVYPDKTATPLTDLSATSLGKSIMKPLTKEGKRAVANVLIVVNPVDYWDKLFGATTVLTGNGTYVHGVLPIPATIVQSVAVPVGKMIAGVSKDYFMGIGSTGIIEYSDDYKFLEDDRTYLTKQYANGLPLDNDSFIVFNIANLSTVLGAEVNVVKQVTPAVKSKVTE